MIASAEDDLVWFWKWQRRRRTKIVATIGPVSSTHDMLRALVEAGMDAVRLNFSHGTHEEHARARAIVREVQDEPGKPLALIADLQGPKLRIGDLAEPRMLLKGEEVARRRRAARGRRRAARRAGGDRRGAAPGPRRPDRRRPHPARVEEVDAGPRALPRASSAAR